MSTEKHKLLKSSTLLYLAIPLLIFEMGWLKASIALISGGLTVIFILAVMKDLFNALSSYWNSLRQIPNRNQYLKSLIWIIPTCVLILLIFCFSGIGGAGYQNSDYLEHNPRVRELILQDWPISLDIDDKPTNYVYYFGYYLPAGLIGKIFQSWLVANLVMFLWSLTGIALSFAWFIKISRVEFNQGKRQKGIRLFFMALIFSLAGGLDIIGAYVLKGMPFDVTSHVDFWAEIFQYSSNTTLIYWVPQHTLTAWLLTGVVIDYLYHPQDLKYLGMTIATSAIWSPFSIVGLAPYLVLMIVIYTWVPKHRQHVYNLHSFLLNFSAMLISSIILLYLASNKYEFPIGWIWEFEDKKSLLLKQLLEFWTLEFAL